MLGTAWGYRWGSLGAGLIGAVIGTIGGYQARTRLVAANGGRDRPIAVGEGSVRRRRRRCRGRLPHQHRVSASASHFAESGAAGRRSSDNRRMMWTTAVARAATAMACVVAGLGAPVIGVAHADDAVGPGGRRTTRSFRTTCGRTGSPGDGHRAGQVCHWFNTQYDALSGQAFGFRQALHDSYDVWSEVQGAGDVLRANLDQSAAFLDPRVHTLYITITRTRAGIRRCTTATRSITCGFSSPRSATRSPARCPPACSTPISPP